MLLKIRFRKRARVRRTYRRKRVRVGRATLLDIKKKLALRRVAKFYTTNRKLFDGLLTLLKTYPPFQPKKKQKYDNIQRILKSKNYRASRHKLNLPVRGQRTHTNAKTRRKRRVV